MSPSVSCYVDQKLPFNRNRAGGMIYDSPGCKSRNLTSLAPFHLSTNRYAKITPLSSHWALPLPCPFQTFIYL